MKILIILPTCYNESQELIKINKAIFPNLTIYYLASLVPAEHSVTVVDESLQELDFSIPVDLVAISVNTPNVTRSYEVADEYRKKGVKVFMGGIHTTFLPDESLKHADAVAVGEADDIWPEMIEDFEKKNLKSIYYGTSRQSLENLLPPRFDLLDSKRYIHLPSSKSPLFPIQTARGCPHNCEFCSVTEFWGAKIRFRPIDNVISEIQMSGGDTYFFTDDNFIANPTRAEQLMMALIPLNIRYMCQLDTTVYRYPELIKLLKKSGCILAFIGFESIDPDNLKKMKKGFNKPENYKTLFKLFHKNAINIYASIIVGLDGDNPDKIKKTVDYFIKMKTSVAAFFPLTPFPGTDLLNQLKQHKRLISDKWWLEKDYASRFIRIKYKTKECTSTELRMFAMKKFYSVHSILYRFILPRKNGLFPFFINLEISKRLKRSMIPII